MIDHMEDTYKSDVFGVEKEDGKVEGIIAAVYQNVFGGDVFIIRRKSSKSPVLYDKRSSVCRWL